MDPRIGAFQKEIEKVLAYLLGEFSRLQTGRASASLVDHVQVEAYGQKQTLKALAGIMVQDAKTIVVQPWDKSILQNIDKALQQAELGTSPTNDGNVIRIILPQMTEERRQQLTKVVHSLSEEARISIRKLRQDVHDKVKADEKDEDVRYSLLDQIQKEVEKANAAIEENMQKKEKEVMTV